MIDVIQKNAEIAQQEREQRYGKHNPFCNEIIRDAEGNEIARAKGAL
jgi:hypothetical protein